MLPVRDTLRADRRRHDCGTIVHRIDDLPLDACAKPKRCDDKPGRLIQLRKLLIRHKAEHFNVLIARKRLNIRRHMRARDPELNPRKRRMHLREDVLNEPEHTILVRRMPEATDKQKTLPVLIVIHDLHLVLIDERRDCLHRNRRILPPDDLFLRNGRIIVHVRFPHDRELDIVPVLRLLERLRIMIHLILPMKPERMKITAEEDQPDIRMLPKKVNILRCNMRTIEVRNIDH